MDRTDDRSPRFLGAYLFAGDLDASIRFYRLLGLEVERVSDMFARALLPDGAAIEIGTSALTRSYDPTWEPPDGPSTNTLNFELGSREAVDETFERLVEAGYAAHLRPCDAPWGARFALVDDPDGNVVGLHSPRDRAAEREREGGQP